MELPGNLLASLYACADRSGTCEDFLRQLRGATVARAAEWWTLADETGWDYPSLRAWNSDSDIHTPTPELPRTGIADGECDGRRVFDTDDGLAVLAHPCCQQGIEYVRVRAFPDEGHSAARNLLEGLQPHIVRSCQLSGQIEPSAAATAPMRLPVLDMLNTGVLLIDGSLKILVMNHYAEQVVSAEDAGLTLREGQLRAGVDPSVDQRLQAALHAATVGSQSSATLSSNTILLDRPDLQARCIIRVSPLPSTIPDANAPGTRALVLITDLQRDPGAPADALRECFQLTVSEAHIATRLLSGQSTKEIAVSLNQREGTVRQHVKSILRKTGTGRQAELVRTLTRAFSVFRV